MKSRANRESRELRVLHETWSIGIHIEEHESSELEFISFVHTLIRNFGVRDYILLNDPSRFHHDEQLSQFWQLIFSKQDFRTEVRVVVNIRVFAHFDLGRFWNLPDIPLDDADPDSNGVKVGIDGKQVGCYRDANFYLVDMMNDLNSEYDRWRRKIG